METLFSGDRSTVRRGEPSFFGVKTRDDKGLYFRRAESLYRTAAVGDSLLVLPFSLIFTKCLKLT